MGWREKSSLPWKVPRSSRSRNIHSVENVRQKHYVIDANSVSRSKIPGFAHIKQPPAPHELGSLQRHDRQLHHLRQKPISPQFLCDATHDELVPECAYEKCDQGRHVAGYVRSGSSVDMSSQEVVDRDVPFARELEP